MTNTYHINNNVRVTGEFYLDGVLTDPDFITLKIMNPDGTITEYTYAALEITRESQGVYYKEILSDQCGDWWYEWTGTGAVVAADEKMYLIESSKFD